jgi:predicted SAM-dependent methyltransferase
VDLKRVAKGIATRFGQFLGRQSAAERYIRGEGIEIGALQDPLEVPKSARVRYVDIASTDELRAMYPRKRSRHLVDVDIVDDGERLQKVADRSQDFVIANHFFEHCADPIGTLENMLRVLKDGGVVFLTIPDKRFIFDRNRPATTFEHVLRDHEEGPEWSKRAHYEEVARFGEGIGDEAELTARVDELIAQDYRIHFHSWNQTEFLELILTLQRRPEFEFEIELFEKNEKEMILVLRQGVPPVVR